MTLTVPGRFALLYATLFAGLGVGQPFLPAYFAAQGVEPARVGVLLAAGSAVKLLAGPASGRLADRLGDARQVLVAASLLAALTASAFGLASGFTALLLVALLHGIVSAPQSPLTDMLTLRAARQRRFDYGRVRSAGSIAFILGSVGGGWAAEWLGIGSAVWLIAGLMGATLLAAWLLPQEAAAARPQLAGFRAALELPGLRRMMLLSALIQGSHAVYYAFGAIHWRQAGLSAGTIGLLWGLGVALEVLLFLFGGRFADRLGPRGLSLLAAGAGVLRWGVTAETTSVPLLALVQCLHAATFGAQHLAAMRLLAASVPPPLAATAQTLHASLGTGLASGVLTLLSGLLYARLGGHAYWAMALLCAAALPVAFGLRRPAGAGHPLGKS